MKNINTPAYILKKEVLECSIDELKSSLSRFFKKNIFSYSLKTNSFPCVLETVRQAGGYAEVVSKDEYELARLIGFGKKDIVYNGPLKSKETFLEAVCAGAVVNIETHKEIEWLKDLPKGEEYKVGIRANIDLKIISPNDAKDNEDYSRFGFSYESGELKFAVDKIKQLENISIEGLHVHRTTLSRSVEVYEAIAQYIGMLVDKLSLDLSYLDIGGGFYGIMEGKPTFDEYFLAVKKGLSQYFDLNELTVIVEPGNAIVASAFDFLTSVIDVKRVRDFYAVTTDGSRNDIDPFYVKDTYFYEVLADGRAENKVPLQMVNGGTCLEYDKLFQIKDECLLSAGDMILYKSVGAYTMTLSPLFIRYFPNVYIFDNGDYSLTRPAWSASDFFDIYKGSR